MDRLDERCLRRVAVAVVVAFERPRRLLLLLLLLLEARVVVVEVDRVVLESTLDDLLLVFEEEVGRAVATALPLLLLAIVVDGCGSSDGTLS